MIGTTNLVDDKFIEIIYNHNYKNYLNLFEFIY